MRFYHYLLETLEGFFDKEFFRNVGFCCNAPNGSMRISRNIGDRAPRHASPRHETRALPGQALIREDTVAFDSPAAVWHAVAHPDIMLAHGSRAVQARP